MLEDYQPRNRIERLRCVLSPEHPMTREDLSKTDLDRLHQYQHIYLALLNNDIAQGKTTDLMIGVVTDLQITKPMFWKLLAETKKLTGYDPDMTADMLRAIQIEKLEALYEELHEDYQGEKTPKMASNLITLRREINYLQNQGQDDGVNMQSIIEQLRLPTVRIITDYNKPDDSNISDAELVD